MYVGFFPRREWSNIQGEHTFDKSNAIVLYCVTADFIETFLGDSIDFLRLVTLLFSMCVFQFHATSLNLIFNLFPLLSLYPHLFLLFSLHKK